MRWLLLLLMAVLLTGCKYKEITREIGYKGKARVNPWLAAERFCSYSGAEVHSLISWEPPGFSDAVWFAPISVFGNESFVRQAESWVREGGHLVLLVEYSDGGNDWGRFSHEGVPDGPVTDMLGRVRIRLKKSEVSDSISASNILFRGTNFEVNAKSAVGVTSTTGEPGVFASVVSGEGRISVLTDGRLFRNRWIGEKDHAAFLDALLHASTYAGEGDIVFIRGAGLSLWSLLGDHLWPVLVGLGVLLFFWLWKSFARFGPLESASAPSPLRAYDHHLEALGDFQWRLDKTATLLAPLRAQILERGQRMCAAAGRRDDDFFQFLADLAGVPRDRAYRALSEPAPPDPATLIRTTADLQKMLQVLH